VAPHIFQRRTAAKNISTRGEIIQRFSASVRNVASNAALPSRGVPTGMKTRDHSQFLAFNDKKQ
jgi:hypothetical protein